MAEQILADNRHTTTREDIRRAIRERTTRGLLTFNSGRVHQLEGELWAVPSTRGGWHKVDLGVEACDCEDHQFRAVALGIACRHIVAAAIAREKRRGARHLVLRHLEDRLAHELLDDEERQQLRDRVLRLRRRLRAGA